MTHLTKMRGLGFLIWAGTVVMNPIACATPILTVSPGACPTNLTACSATNNVVKADVFYPFLIEANNDTSGAFSNLFRNAFNTWNLSLAAAERWTLATADLSNTAVLTVQVYRAYVDEGCGATCGGAEIRVLYTPGAGDPSAITDPANINPSQSIWSQSIATNQKRDPSLPGNPYLDNAPGTLDAQLGPPAYPFEYAGSRLYDMPGRDAEAYWLGQGFLSTANYTTRTLTVYDGIGWGFTVAAVPEPATFVMICFAMAVFAFLPRR